VPKGIIRGCVAQSVRIARAYADIVWFRASATRVSLALRWISRRRSHAAIMLPRVTDYRSHDLRRAGRRSRNTREIARCSADDAREGSAWHGANRERSSRRGEAAGEVTIGAFSPYGFERASPTAVVAYWCSISGLPRQVRDPETPSASSRSAFLESYMQSTPGGAEKPRRCGTPRYVRDISSQYEARLTLICCRQPPVVRP